MKVEIGQKYKMRTEPSRVVQVVNISPNDIFVKALSVEEGNKWLKVGDIMDFSVPDLLEFYQLSECSAVELTLAKYEG